MKPGKQIVLLRPDQTQSGPSIQWIEQLSRNLKLVSQRVKVNLADPVVLVPGDKKAGSSLKDYDVILVIFHESWFSNEAYMKLIENEVVKSNNKEARVFLIFTSPDKKGILRKKLGQFPFFSFYRTGGREENQGFLDESYPAYWSGLLDLVQDLAMPPKTAGYIYLAQTETDLSSSRDILRRELIEHGFSVVPELDLNGYQKDLKAFIRQMAESSRLVIHLLGNRYGDPVPPEALSISEIQLRYMGECLETIEKDKEVTSRSKPSRLIWVDPEFHPLDNRQADLVEELKRNIEKLYRTEIIQAPLELFKTMVINRLEEDQVSAGMKQGLQSDKKWVYIIHHRDDEKSAGELVGRISGGGLNGLMLDYGKGHADLLREHKYHLKNCDASIVYYGNPNRPWLRSKIRDLLKAPGYGRTRPLELRQVLAAGKDKLEDLNLPREIEVQRESDPGRVLTGLIKHLKQ